MWKIPPWYTQLQACTNGTKLCKASQFIFQIQANVLFTPTPPLKTSENPVVYNRKIGLKSVKNIALIIKNIFQD